MTVSLKEARILVIDDDATNRFVLVKLLQVEGVAAANIVALPGDPTAYLTANPDVHFDLVLLDIQMPGKDGFAVLADLRQDARFVGVPVTAVTANVMRSDVERVVAARFDGLLGKPINGPRLGEWLQRILAGELVWKIS
ncbi:MAG: response regulator [Chloroflexota bacterium]